MKKPKPNKTGEWEKELHSIATDIWANINETLQKRGVKYTGNGIGDAYAGWVALGEIFYSRTKNLLFRQIQKAIENYAKEVIPFKNKKWRKRIQEAEKRGRDLGEWIGERSLKNLEQIRQEERQRFGKEILDIVMKNMGLKTENLPAFPPKMDIKDFIGLVVSIGIGKMIAELSLKPKNRIRH